jgi:hypothetical protein
MNGMSILRHGLVWGGLIHEVDIRTAEDDCTTLAPENEIDYSGLLRTRDVRDFGRTTSGTGRDDGSTRKYTRRSGEGFDFGHDTPSRKQQSHLNFYISLFFFFLLSCCDYCEYALSRIHMRGV